MDDFDDWHRRPLVDDEGLVHFPFAERAGWPSDPLPIGAIG